MEDDLFIAHNPDSVWQVPDTFRSIYSHAVEVGKPSRILFVSGQFGVAPDGHVREDFAAQCGQGMDNVEALLATADMSTANLVKLTYYATRHRLSHTVADPAAPLGSRPGAFGYGNRCCSAGEARIPD
jgi:enamine deaminase RidA (YjgF/YER057c/UK114 family)